MRTVQDYLRQADRDELLDSMAYDALSDMSMLLACKDMTVEQIQEDYKAQTNRFIDY